MIPGLDLVNEDGNLERETVADGNVKNGENVLNGDINHKLTETTTNSSGSSDMEVDRGTTDSVANEQSGTNISNANNTDNTGSNSDNIGNDNVDSANDKLNVTDDLDPENFEPKVDLIGGEKKEGETSSSENLEASAESEVDIDDRLASFAKASEMLHSIAKMAQADSELNTEDDYKSDSELETEVDDCCVEKVISFTFTLSPLRCFGLVAKLPRKLYILGIK